MEKSLIKNKTIVSNGVILSPLENLGVGSVIIEDGVIVGVEKGVLEVEGYETIDAKGSFIAPGFIDIHTHGGGDMDFMDCSIESFLTPAKLHAEHGTTLLFPTSLACDREELFSFFDLYEEAEGLNEQGAILGGIHLEGPYFAYNHRGAQDPKYLKNPTPGDYEEILERSNKIVRWSIAPELDGAKELAKVLVKRGILPSIAHTDAIYEEVVEAFSAGFTHITHFYSCMNGVTRRDAFRYAGCVEAGYLIEGMTIEIIADGVHVPTPLFKLAYSIKGAEKIALITDSMRGAGMPPGKSVIGSLKRGQEVIIEDGVAKLPDRSAFAGSVATADRLVRTVYKEVGISLIDSVKMMTTTPAKIMGISNHKGRVAKGYDADLVIFDDNIRIHRTIINGKQVYRND